jgi:hypothetical protein
MAWRFCGRCRAARQCVFCSQKKTVHDCKGLKQACVLSTSDPRVNKYLDKDSTTSIPTTFSHPNGDQVPETKVCALLCIFVEFAGRQSRLEEQTDNEWWDVFPPHCYSEEAEFLLPVQRKSRWILWMTYAQKGGYYVLYRLILKDKLHFSGDSGLARPSEGVRTVSTGFTPSDASNKWTISIWTRMVIIRLIHSPHHSHKYGNPQLNLAACDFTVCNTCLTHLLHTFLTC